jgi:FixJ family two-component response regulator
MDLPGISGPELVKQINQHSNHIPLILLSHQPRTASTVKVMKLGAVSLIEIPFQENLLRDEIDEAITRSDAEFAERQQRRLVKSRLQQLNEKERVVIRLLMDGMANKVMAKRIGVSVRTVESRRHDVFQKMGVRSLAELVHEVVAAQCIDEIKEL